MNDILFTLCQDFFEKLCLDFSELNIEAQAEHIYHVSLQSEDSHILIGPHGKNLENLSQLLGLLISKQTGERCRVHVGVNDYLEKKEEKLERFIQSKIDYVKESGKEIILPFFTAYERKKVHSYVSEKWGNVFTQSIGEGSERRIHLSKKDEKMTIDIDGDDI
jgi:predicted RNA-binding protein Jag